MQAYDWSTVARQVVEVYETVAAMAPAAVHVDVDAELETLAVDLAAVDGNDDDAGRLVTTLRRWLSERRAAVGALGDRPRS